MARSAFARARAAPLAPRPPLPFPSFTRPPPSHRSDVWALGCVLFHLCAGEALFPAKYDDLDQEHLRLLLGWADAGDFKRDMLPKHRCDCQGFGSLEIYWNISCVDFILFDLGLLVWFILGVSVCWAQCESG